MCHNACLQSSFRQYPLIFMQQVLATLEIIYGYSATWKVNFVRLKFSYVPHGVAFLLFLVYDFILQSVLHCVRQCTL